MAKLVDALGLGSNEFIHAGSSPVLRKQVIICSFIFSLYTTEMKHFYTNKNKAFPFATSQKKAVYQQWNIMPKPKVKKVYKYKSRFFSMEFGRSFSKRILWQIAVSKPSFNIQDSFYYTTNTKIGDTVSTKNNMEMKSFLGQKTISLDKKIQPYQQSWKAFRTVLFGKMWMLYDPSLVPGITWPVKHKKILLTKMRAYKALSQLVGKPQKKYLTTQLQKFASISNQTTPILWSIAGGLESQKTSVLVKSNFVCTLPAASHSITKGDFNLNGQTLQKSLGFSYAGDILFSNIMAENPSVNNAGNQETFSSFFSKVFSYGPLKSTSFPIPKNIIRPFLWLSSFYNYGKILNFYGQPKGILKKRRFYRKNNNFHGKVK